MSYIKKSISYSALSFCFALIIMCFCPNEVCAAENELKTVRIGWYQTYLFQEGMSDEEPKSGYSYEYIHHIADYNGWNYEYVYGEWADLLAMLESGEIDMLACVSKMEERLEYLLYPNMIMGNQKV